MAFVAKLELISYFISKLPGHGNLDEDDNILKLWNDFRHVAILASCNNGVSPSLPADSRRHERSLSALINAVFEFFTALEGKRRCPPCILVP